MSTTDETKPAGKSKRRKGKAERSKKAAASPVNVPEIPAPAELQSPEPQPVQAESPKADPLPAVEVPALEEPVVAVVASPEPQPAVAPALSEPVPTAPLAAEQASAEPPPAKPMPVEPAPVSLQTIANAYRDYTRKSIQDFGSFVEQLSGVRSLDKAMTVQSEFVKRAYETSVAESQKICELHNRLAKQTLDPFKGFTGKAPTPHGKA